MPENQKYLCFIAKQQNLKNESDIDISEKNSSLSLIELLDYFPQAFEEKKRLYTNFKQSYLNFKILLSEF